MTKPHHALGNICKSSILIVVCLPSVITQCSPLSSHPSRALKELLKSCLFVSPLPAKSNYFALSQEPRIINEKISQSLPFKKVEHKVSSLDAQPSDSGAIVILLAGTLLVCEDQQYSHVMGY